MNIEALKKRRDDLSTTITQLQSRMAQDQMHIHANQGAVEQINLILAEVEGSGAKAPKPPVPGNFKPEKPRP